MFSHRRNHSDFVCNFIMPALFCFTFQNPPPTPLPPNRKPMKESSVGWESVSDGVGGKVCRCAMLNLLFLQKLWKTQECRWGRQHGVGIEGRVKFSNVQFA